MLASVSEVVARSGFGFYLLGWLRRSCRLNPPKKLDKQVPIPPQRRLPRPLTKEANQSKRHQAERSGTCGRIGFRLIRTWVAPAPFRGGSPNKPDKLRPVRAPERVPVSPSEEMARCADQDISGAAGR